MKKKVKTPAEILAMKLKPVKPQRIVSLKNPKKEDGDIKPFCSFTVNSSQFCSRSPNCVICSYQPRKDENKE